ncbi:MAG TPA: response regulator [Vicinamibacterales bacterium]|nr:response regulator [Vicinamibacterales bacterium]
MSNFNEVEILLVEDSPEDAELTMRTLRMRNLANRLHHVEDGAAALDFIFGRGQFAGRDVNTRPKVVLLDLKLPKVDGLEVLRTIKEDSRTRDIPVVVITSSREDRDLDEAYRLGANSYVVKPVDFNQFSEAVGRLGLYWVLINEMPRAAGS